MTPPREAQRIARLVPEEEVKEEMMALAQGALRGRKSLEKRKKLVKDRIRIGSLEK